MEIDLFIDCGAPSLFNKLMRKNEEGKRNTLMGLHLKDRTEDKQDFSFTKSDDYKAYRKAYIAFIKKHEQFIEVYPNLDIINNPAATYKNQKYLEKRGIKPMPVFHLGSDVKWLQRYIEEGYKYIALGGITPETPANVYPALDRLWNDHLTDNKGMPLVKVHGFAVTSVRLMMRYPWYSVDSASWVKQAAYGSILIPVKRNGEYVYDETGKTIFVSTRSSQIKNAGKHIDTLPAEERKNMVAFFEQEGYKLGKSEFKTEKEGYEAQEGEILHGKPKEGKQEVEIIIEPGLCNDYKERKKFNMSFYCHIMKRAPKWPWAFKVKAPRGFV